MSKKMSAPPLVDLAKIDMYLRLIILEMALNIEHFAKVKLIGLVTDDEDEDGYSIVSDYIKALSDESRLYLQRELKRNSKSPYFCDAFNKYKQDLPIWVFLEAISFGSFISFYSFSIERFSHKLPPRKYKALKDAFYLMLSVKYIRNAAAHNNCVLNDLKSKTGETKRKTNWNMARAIRNAGISAVAMKRKLSNERIQQVITCFWAHKFIVSSKGVDHHISVRLHNWTSRLFRDYDYSFNALLKTTFDIS